MAKAKKASPGIGHNSNLPTHETIRNAVALEMIMEKEAKDLRERHKVIRKRIEGMEISREDMTRLKGFDGLTASEIEQRLRRDAHFIMAINDTVQFDLFPESTDSKVRKAAHYHLGLMRGLKGEDMAPSPLVVGEDLQQLTAGYNEGVARREASAAILEEALKPENEGKVADGTSAAVNARAAKDFAEDQGEDPLVVDGVRYDNMRKANAARKRKVAGEPTADAEPDGEPREEGEAPIPDASDAAPEQSDLDAAIEAQRQLNAGAEPKSPPEPMAVTAGSRAPNWGQYSDKLSEWFATQKMEARNFFESVGEDYVPMTTNPAVGEFWRQWKAEKELDRKTAARQEAELPDEAEVAAQAAALSKTGFVADGRAAAKAEAAKRRARIGAR